MDKEVFKYDENIESTVTELDKKFNEADQLLNTYEELVIMGIASFRDKLNRAQNSIDVIKRMKSDFSKETNDFLGNVTYEVNLSIANDSIAEVIVNMRKTLNSNFSQMIRKS